MDCRKESPSFVKLHEEFKNTDLVLLKVAIKDREKDMKRYRNKFNISLPILIDNRAQVANAYGVWSHPETFFINREGKIVGKTFGGKDWTSENMRNLIQYLLEGTNESNWSKIRGKGNRARLRSILLLISLLRAKAIL